MSRPSIQNRGAAGGNIGKRRADAMRAQAEGAAAESTPPEATAGEAPHKSAPAKRPAKTKAPTRPAATKTSTASSMERVGIYITPEDHDAAKSGYLAAWEAGGDADRFRTWIGQALEEHAARTPAERARLARPTGRASKRTGASRSFDIPTDTIARVRTAIRADNKAGRYPSDSAWYTDAIAAAVEVAREANGGVLPDPPPRLPVRMKR